MPVKCDNLLTPKEACLFLGISNKILRKWRLGGILAVVRPDNSTRLKYDINELNRVKELRNSHALMVSKELAKEGKHWSQEDLNYLADNYGLLSNKVLARDLQRSVDIVKYTARRKLHIQMTDNFYTAIELARLLGFYSSGPVIRYARKGWLKGSRKLCGERWYWCFTEDSIVRFLRQRPWLIDLKSMGRSYFRSVVKKEWDEDPWYTTEQAAPLLGVSSTSIPRYIQRGWLPVDPVDIQRAGGVSYIIRGSTIEAFLKDAAAARRRFDSRSNRITAARNHREKQGFPTRIETTWLMVCPGCGQEVRIVAPPSMVGAEVRKRFISVYVNGRCFHSAKVDLTIPG